jgi:hypothetical protein
MGVVWVRLPKARFANDFGVGFDRCLDSIGFGVMCDRFDGGGLGSIDFGGGIRSNLGYNRARASRRLELCQYN